MEMTREQVEKHIEYVKGHIQYLSSPDSFYLDAILAHDQAQRERMEILEREKIASMQWIGQVNLALDQAHAPTHDSNDPLIALLPHERIQAQLQQQAAALAKQFRDETQPREFDSEELQKRLTTALRDERRRGMEEAATIAEKPENLRFVGGSTGNCWDTQKAIAEAIRESKQYGY